MFGFWPGSVNPRDGGASARDERRLRIGVRNVSKNGPHQDAIIGTLQELLARLDEDCADYLGGREAVADRIRSLIDTAGSPLVAHGSVIPNSIAAFTGGRQSDFEPGDLNAAEAAVGNFAMLVNDDGAFFNSSFAVNNRRLSGGTSRARRFILLHELGHSLSAPGFENDFNDAAAARRNDDRINQHCGRTFD